MIGYSKAYNNLLIYVTDSGLLLEQNGSDVSLVGQEVNCTCGSGSKLLCF